MPKKKQTVRADNRYEYKATIGRSFDGKLIRKSFYSTKSLADAKKQAEEYKIKKEVSERTGEAFIASQYNFAQWAEKWLETYKKPFVDENTYNLTYKSIVRGHLIPYFGAARLQDIRPADIQKYFADKKHCSESRLKNMKSCLTAIFESAIENDLCYKNPARRVTFKSEAKKHKKSVLTDTQIATVKEFTKGAMPEVFLLLETGLRRGEVLGLMWSDYAPENGTLAVNRSLALKSNKVVANQPKWGSTRTLPLSPDAISLIEELPHTSMYMFPNEKGSPHSPASWSHKLARFMKTMQAQHPDIPKLTAHELRHTYGTMLRRKGVDIYTIQKMLGHKDINMTAEIYVHNEIDELKKSVAIAFESPKTKEQKQG